MTAEVTAEDWITALTRTLDGRDPATIQQIKIRRTRPKLVGWWMEAEVVYDDGSKTTVI